MKKAAIQNTDLKMGTRLLYSHLKTMEQPITLTNREIAEFFGVKRITAASWISELSKYGYINTEFEFMENGVFVSKRKIWVNK